MVGWESAQDEAHHPEYDDYPRDYRAAEVAATLRATRAGESVAVVGLGGAGKSNLLRFLARRQSTARHPMLLVDANRLLEPGAVALLHLVGQALGSGEDEGADSLAALSDAIAGRLEAADTITLLLDRFDLFTEPPQPLLFNALRALRDDHKYRLCYVVATRRPLPASSELAELFDTHTLWLGSLQESDARWNVARHAARYGQQWPEPVVAALLALSGGYPSLLKAACTAHAAGAPLDNLDRHPAVRARVADFWDSGPTAEQLRLSGLADHALLLAGRGPLVAPGELTAKEQLLYDYLLDRAGEVCDRDELIRAVWPEDAVYEAGVRDSSLAQLVRRLRVKLEPDPAEPRFVETVPGRGYLFRPGTRGR
jgi:hypothetical protein